MEHITHNRKYNGLLRVMGYVLREKAFTLIEILVVIAVITILVAVIVGVYSSFRSKIDLDTNSQMILNTLRLAQSKTLASEGASNYGVHFEQEKCVLFKGNVYNPVAPDNRFYDFSSRLEIPVASGINLNGGGNEVIFDRITGNTFQSGEIKLQLKSDNSQCRIIKTDLSGEVSIKGTAVPLSSPSPRVTDSRHVHFSYTGRIIDTANEIIILTFEDPVTTKDIKISDFIIGGQFDWEGTVDVGGDEQKIHIHTHWLNDPILGTQFCIHRDRRYNNKTLTVTISGDGSGDIINYTASGEESRGESIHLAPGEDGNPQRQ